jgi:RNA polymerase sigma-70 factor, ECF subfamily
MTEPVPQDVTQLLRAWSAGEPGALEKLTPLVYKELHRLAKRYMRQEGAGHTLQTTALVNEAYLRLVDSSHVSWQSRAHFLAVSAQVMRHILVDFARSRQYLRRGGSAERLSLDEGLVVSRQQSGAVVAVDEALKALAAVDQRKSQVVELRFFGGLSVEETAEALSVSPETVLRDWKLAKAWLLRALKGEKRGEG